MTEKCHVACTVMAKDSDGDYVFLVENQQKKFKFFHTGISQGKTGLASIIDKIKNELAIDVSELELYELTNAVVESRRIPLFVFSCRDEAMHFEEILASDSDLTWRYSKELLHTFKEWQIAGVPQFQKEN